MFLYRLAQIAQQLDDEGHHDLASDLDSAVSDLEPAPIVAPEQAPLPVAATAEQPTTMPIIQPSRDNSNGPAKLNQLVRTILQDFMSNKVAPEDLISPEGQNAFKEKLYNVISAGEDIVASGRGTN